MFDRKELDKLIAWALPWNEPQADLADPEKPSAARLAEMLARKLQDLIEQFSQKPQDSFMTFKSLRDVLIAMEPKTGFTPPYMQAYQAQVVVNFVDNDGRHHVGGLAIVSLDKNTITGKMELVMVSQAKPK